jgi:hypothetical protein
MAPPPARLNRRSWSDRTKECPQLGSEAGSRHERRYACRRVSSAYTSERGDEVAAVDQRTKTGPHPNTRWRRACRGHGQQPADAEDRFTNSEAAGHERVATSSVGSSAQPIRSKGERHPDRHPHAAEGADNTSRAHPTHDAERSRHSRGASIDEFPVARPSKMSEDLRHQKGASNAQA